MDTSPPPGEEHPATISRSAYSTRDPEEAQDFFAQAFLGARWRRSVDKANFRLANRRIDAGPFQIDQMRMTSRVASTFRPDDVYYVTYLAGGSFRTRRDGGEEELVGPGQVVLGGRVGIETTTETDDLSQHVITVPLDAVREACGIERGRDEVPRFASIRPTDERRHAHTWAATRAYLAAVLEDEAATGSPLLVGSATRLLASLLVETFELDGAVASKCGRRDRHDAKRPASLRRAVDFIDRNAQRDIGIGEIAEAARVSPRAVEAAFRRHRGTTPTGYLRQVRLDHAHRELSEAADPDRLTVTEVAYRWGFSSPSRFSEYYRRAFGHPPSETLAR
jgi:AraC-like DNA-binding protein